MKAYISKIPYCLNCPNLRSEYSASTRLKFRWCKVTGNVVEDPYDILCDCPLPDVDKL